MILDFCAVCGLDGDAFDLHLHHFVPKSKGGSDDETNMLTLCQDCHHVIHGRKKLDVSHSALTKRGLSQAKDRGVKLGGNRGNIDKANEAASQKAKQDAEQYRKHIELIRSSGVTTFKGIATKLNELGVKTVRGGEFQAVQVKRLIEKLEG